MPKPKPTGYVVSVTGHLRDGEDHFARVFQRRADAVAFIDKVASGFAGDACTFALFELGRQIPVTAEHVEEPQPAKTRRRYKVGE